jgi:hypothetical protein
MKLICSDCMRTLTVLVAMLAALPVYAGGTRSSVSIDEGHPGSARGIPANHYRSRNLPNGVSIFNQRNNVAQVPATRPARRTRASHFRHDGAEKPWHARGFSQPKRMETASNRRGPEKSPHEKHTGHGTPQPVYTGSIIIVAPASTDVAAVESDGEKCRFLTERGYDRSGRRVLVEWTVCFDDQGAAYVPDEGRRILARF